MPFWRFADDLDMAAPIQTGCWETEVLPERRHHDRLITRTPIILTRIEDVNVMEECICTDVSVAGVGIETEAFLNPGEIIEFQFAENDGCPIRYRARILYRDGTRYGAYFTQAD